MRGPSCYCCSVSRGGVGSLDGPRRQLAGRLARRFASSLWVARRGRARPSEHMRIPREGKCQSTVFRNPPLRWGDSITVWSAKEKPIPRTAVSHVSICIKNAAMGRLWKGWSNRRPLLNSNLTAALMKGSTDFAPLSSAEEKPIPRAVLHDSRCSSSPSVSPFGARSPRFARALVRLFLYVHFDGACAC